MRPPDFSYKHEAKHSSTLVVAKLFEDEEGSNKLLLENLAHLLESVRACGSFHIRFMMHNNE